MIELIAEGPVEVCKDGRFGPRKDGHDTIAGRVELTRTSEVRVDVEFEQGHVNLEGYVPSHVEWPVEECVGGFVSEAMDLPYGMLEYEDREWTIELRGEWWDWIQQAHRYMTERPRLSVLDALRLFRGWNETDDDTLGDAIANAKRCSMAQYEAGELTQDDWVDLRTELNHGFEHVSIPESYSD